MSGHITPSADGKVVLYWEGNTDGTIGGSQVFMYDLISHLNKREFEPIAGFAQDNAVAEQFRANGIETLVYTQPAPVDVRAMKFPSPLWRRVAVPLLLPIQKAMNFVRRFLVPAVHHAIYLRRRGVDIIDLNNSITRNHEWMLAGMLAGVPCVTHEAGINDRYSKSSRFFHRRLRAVICCSHAIAANMKAHGLDHPLLPVIHSCVSTARMQVRETAESVRARFGLADRGPIIGVVGNIKEWKGQETVVRATALLADRWPGLVCLLVGKVGFGDEPFHERLLRISRELGIDQRVIFTGYQPNPADFMNVMDVFIHSSTHPEPFGMVNLEAMGLGKPVVATNIGGPVEVFEDGVSGLLIQPGDPLLLAAAVERLLGDREFALRMGQAARRRRMEHFRLEDTVEKTQAVYRRVLGMARDPTAKSLPGPAPPPSPAGGGAEPESVGRSRV